MNSRINAGRLAVEIEFTSKIFLHCQTLAKKYRDYAKLQEKLLKKYRASNKTKPRRLTVEIELSSQILSHCKALVKQYESLAKLPEKLVREYKKFCTLTFTLKNEDVIHLQYDICKNIQRANRLKLIEALNKLVNEANSILPNYYIEDMKKSIRRLDKLFNTVIDIPQHNYDEYKQQGELFSIEYINLIIEINSAVHKALIDSKNTNMETPLVKEMVETVSHLSKEERVDMISKDKIEKTVGSMLSEHVMIYYPQVDDEINLYYDNSTTKYNTANNIKIISSLTQAYFATRRFQTDRIPLIWKRRQVEEIEDLNEETRNNLIKLGAQLLSNDYDNAASTLVTIPKDIRLNLHRYDSLLKPNRLREAMIESKKFRHARQYGKELEENSLSRSDQNSSSSSPSGSPTSQAKSKKPTQS